MDKDCESNTNTFCHSQSIIISQGNEFYVLKKETTISQVNSIKQEEAIQLSYPIFHFGFQDSWSSDEGEGISVEELKDTKGYKLFMKALQAHAKNSAKSV